jgi:hypothetical protein
MQILDFFTTAHTYSAKGPPLPWVREYWPMLFGGNINRWKKETGENVKERERKRNFTLKW